MYYRKTHQVSFFYSLKYRHSKLISQIFARKIFQENIVRQVSSADLLKIMMRHVRLCRHGQNSNQRGSENIITTFGYGRLNRRGRLYVDMEICLCSLHDFIKSDARETIFGIEAFLNPRGDEEDVSRSLSFWRISKDIARGLCFLHATKLIHRDIKPRNSLHPFLEVLRLTWFSFTVQTRHLEDHRL
jgi:serine/threonine protein kinase